eukprot:scaffold3806_cov94-Isochrysis_galbana.AAC.12
MSGAGGTSEVQGIRGERRKGNTKGERGGYSSSKSPCPPLSRHLILHKVRDNPPPLQKRNRAGGAAPAEAAATTAALTCASESEPPPVAPRYTSLASRCSAHTSSSAVSAPCRRALCQAAGRRDRQSRCSNRLTKYRMPISRMPGRRAAATPKPASARGPTRGASRRGMAAAALRRDHCRRRRRSRRRRGWVGEGGAPSAFPGDVALSPAKAAVGGRRCAAAARAHARRAATERKAADPKTHPCRARSGASATDQHNCTGTRVSAAAPDASRCSGTASPQESSPV